MNHGFSLRPRYRSLLLGLAVALLPASLSAQTPAPSKAQQLDELVQQYAKAGQFNGTLLVADQGKVVLQKGYGLANQEQQVPNTADTKFRLGSLTKQFTAVAVLQLVEKKQLRLDGTVSDYLPDYPPATGRRITLHHLLTHTSGIPSYTGLPNYVSEISRTAYTPAQLVQVFAGLPLEFEPGTRYKYNNSGYALLGAIIEKVTGKTYAQVLQDNIFKPLRMTNSGYDNPNVALANRAAGYEAKPGGGFEPTTFVDMSVPYSAGALYSTVGDLYRWSQALDGTKLLSEASKKLMFTAYKNNYGYGWIVAKGRLGADSVRLQEHNGAVNGFRTYLTRVPERGQLVILLDNTSSSSLRNLKNGLPLTLNGLPAPTPSAIRPTAAGSSAPGVAVSEAVLQTYTRRYQLASTFIITVTREKEQLYVQATGQQRFEVVPESATKFNLRGVPAQVEFVADAQGQIARLVLHQGGYDQSAARIE